MLPEAFLVKARRCMEKMYIGVCTVSGYQKVKNADESTALEETIIYENIPCRLSYKNFDIARPTDTGNILSQTIKVFLEPDVHIPAGSKLTIMQNGVTTEYQSSSEPTIFQTHQEIVLELFEGWA